MKSEVIGYIITIAAFLWFCWSCWEVACNGILSPLNFWEVIQWFC